MFDIEVKDYHQFKADGFVVHNCQGSTIENVVVLANDLMSVRPWDYDTKRRWMYTAVTRASKNVYIII